MFRERRTYSSRTERRCMNASRLVSLFLCLSLALPCAAFADTAPASGQKTDAPASTPKPVPDPTQDVWTTLLQNRVEELGAIDAETVALTKRLPDASRKLNAALSGIEEEYQRLMTLSRVSRGCRWNCPSSSSGWHG